MQKEGRWTSIQGNIIVLFHCCFYRKRRHKQFSQIDCTTDLHITWGNCIGKCKHSHDYDMTVYQFPITVYRKQTASKWVSCVLCPACSMQGLLLVVVPTNCHVHVIYVICIFKHYPEVIGQTMPTEIFPCTRKEVQRYFARVTYFLEGL